MSVLDAAGLPDQFGFLLLAIATILLLSPYLSGHDLGVIKIPNLSEKTKKSLKLGGPVFLVAAILLHVNVLPEATNEDGLTTSDSRSGGQVVPIERGLVEKCSVSGMVFDLNTNQPISALSVGVQSDPGKTQRPVPLERHVATTGPDGSFVFQCDWIKADQYPILVSVSHRNWVATHIGPKVPRPGEWEGINFPIDLANLGMKERPLEEIGVSFGTRFKDETITIAAGKITNKSERVFSCVRITFDLKKDGQWSGSQDVVIKNLKAMESRPYEAELPPGVGYKLQSKAEC